MRGAKDKLRKLVAAHTTAVYQAVKAGKVEGLSGEDQLLAKAIQDHLHLSHFHNALEFADVREGEPYIVEDTSPLAHIAVHAAVEGQIEQDEDVKAAFEKLLAVGVDGHHARHLLGKLFLQRYWDVAKAAERGEQPHKYEAKYQRALEKICTDSSFRRKWIRGSSAGHPWAETDNS